LLDAHVSDLLGEVNAKDLIAFSQHVAGCGVPGTHFEVAGPSIPGSAAP
jgi:hypothetical protein